MFIRHLLINRQLHKFF